MSSTTNHDIYFICDANAQSGMGHFLRCISLAVQLQNVGKKCIFCGDYAPFALMFANYVAITLQHNTGSVAERLRQLPLRSKVVLDSYQYETSDLLPSHSYVLIDDFCMQSVYPVAGVINFTLRANRFNYLAKGAKKQALGLNFFLPHPSLLKAARHFNKNIKRILIIIGSGDPYQISERLIDVILATSGEYDIKVVTANVAVETRSSNRPGVYYVPPKSNVNEYYQWADFCITSGGLAKYECAYLAKPSAVISLTQDEQHETESFALSNLCFDMGFYADMQKDRLVALLSNILFQPTCRLLAYQSCLEAFKHNSLAGLIEFVESCWEVDT
jgi:UDP-2,4-diacetamido-2,4,6-trideoxy-beta-L-altropyranose hydrolase